VLEGEGSGHRTGHYTSGWIKRGPSGVIGTNKKCAQETVDHLLSDADAGKLHEPEAPDPDAIEELLRERGVDFVSFRGWQAIDAAEVARGEPQGRPRVKFVRVEEMLEAARESVSG
jgi:ferredoxin--NADP+ reductase